MADRETDMPWLYEPDENPKRKHHWNKDYAGFVEVGPNRVGKCPATLNLSDAQALLEPAVPSAAVRGPRRYRLSCCADQPRSLVPWFSRAPSGIPAHW